MAILKKFLPVGLACGWLGAGCVFGHHHAAKAPQPVPVPVPVRVPAPAPAPAAVRVVAKPIMTADISLAATVISVDTVGRFVVLNFPDGRLPRLNAHFFLYRGGLKTGEVKVVGPQKDTSIVADIVAGDAKAGDTVRDQ